MSLTSHSIVIAGGGPTELILASEPALAGVDAAGLDEAMTTWFGAP